MKLLLIALTIYTSIYGNNISDNSNYNNCYNSLFPEQTGRIGYTTNYSNGQFNSGVYKSSTVTLEHQNRAFTSTYTHAASSSGGSRPRGPRRVAGYTRNGEYIDDGKGYGDSDSAYFWNWISSGTYYYYNGNWYLYDDGGWCIWKYGKSYRRWSRTYYEDWGWYYSTSNPDYYNPFSPSQDPSNYEMKPSLLPLGPPGILILFIFFYVIYKKKRSIS